jgi:endoglucanase
MSSRARDSLTNLLDAKGPSGFETEATLAWRALADEFADTTWSDIYGSGFARVGEGGSPRVMLAGHIDEIGLMIHHVDDQGFLYVREVGGWDPQVLVGQRVEILSTAGRVAGVIGRRAIHLIERSDREKAVKLKDLWIDIGAPSGDEARERVSIGDVAVIRSDTLELGSDLVAARSIDDRIGAVVALEALRLASEAGSKADVVAVATTQEEVGYASGGGARTSSFELAPDVAIVIDVTHATDHPTLDAKEHGEVKLGRGPVLSRGAVVNQVVYRLLVEAAERAGVPYQVHASPSASGTDADAIFTSRSGVATGIVSIPNRYMHSPNQIVSMADVEQAASLIASFIDALDEDTSFIPA